MTHPVLFWTGFHLLVAALLAMDLGLFKHKNSTVTFKKACFLSLFWIGIALLFNLFIYYSLGPESALQFFTGYLIEKSLSIDNLFVFLIIFLHFQIPHAFQYKILFLGILGTLILRITLILAGVALIHRFHFIFYLFGAILLISGLQFLFQKEQKTGLSEGLLLRLIKKIFPVLGKGTKGEFFVHLKGKRRPTPLFLALLMIEGTDILFALDSIPAIFAITTDPFIIYTSNIFAILGLRSLYFVLASSLEKLHYLKYGLGSILLFVSLKMLLKDFVSISLPVSLGIILGILGLTSLASWIFSKTRKSQT